MALPGCATMGSLVPRLDTGPPAGQSGFVRGFLGGVAAEEPRAALVAREVLSAGGSATDAAVAAGFALAVTLPSRAALGGGGACLVFDPSRGETEAVLFPPGARGAPPPGADRPAAVPMLARGLFALHTRGGRRPFEELISPAEGLARFGTPVSRALATDLAPVAGPLLADPAARGVFARPGGGAGPLGEGDQLTQPELATTLAQLRTAGVGDLYTGGLARRLEEASGPAGGGLTVPELRAAVPQVLPPVTLRAGSDVVGFLPPPADPGGATAAAFQAMAGGAGLDAAASAAAARLSRGAAAGLGASTGLVVLDRDGGAVSCAFTMNNLFGTGRIAGNTGILLATAPGLGAVEAPPLAAVLATNANLRAFRMGVAASGQQAAPIAAAGPAALHLLRGVSPAEAIAAGSPAPGRTQMIACPRYLPGSAASCVAASDGRGAGVALSGER